MDEVEVEESSAATVAPDLASLSDQVSAEQSNILIDVNDASGNDTTSNGGAITYLCSYDTTINLSAPQVFELQARVHPWIWPLGPLAGAFIILVVGMTGARRLVHSPPMQVLRGFN